ncbi:thiamine phosphate synthase [Nibricoccus sp. IMCC34717]|uniref:thiamine phosphate synthase n=1 Tax=Nibricoccus sp. IMCC34717 TaxID=3034021 RepID=UPI00384A6209
MAITHDRPDLPHLAQVRRLLDAGVTWIQLRMKTASEVEKLATARSAAELCRAAGAVLIINDSVDLALASGANGVHLGREDEAWETARKRLGATLILGGTVNYARDAERAATSGCVDYVGVGPWRHTTTKQRLAPVLGPDGIRPLLQRLSPIPAWVIGGVLPADMPTIRSLGAAGAAVSSGLIQEDCRAAVAAYQASWGTF